MTFFSFTPPALIGLDVQPDSVKFVQLRAIRHRYVVEYLAMAALPPGVFAHGKIERFDVLSATLATLVQAAGMEGCAAAINLPVNLVRMQRIKLPKGLAEEEIEEEIHLKIQRDLPGMTDALCVDFQVIPSQYEADSEVFFAAVRREYLSQYTDCVNAAGLKTKIVDVDIYALKRAARFALQGKSLQNETNVLVSVMANNASFIVFNAQEMLFHEQWEVADKADFLAQLKHRMAICLAALQPGQIRQLLFCAAQDYLAILLADRPSSWAYPICCPNPFDHMALAASLDSHLIQSRASDFLVACGLAMRSVPQW